MTTRMINWILSKAMGNKTIDECCRDSVVAYLTKIGVVDTVFSYVLSERSSTDNRFMLRLYFGSGYRSGKKVAFVLLVDENVPKPFGCYLLKSGDLPEVKSMYNQWKASDERGMGLSFDSYLSYRAGDIEELPNDIDLRV